MPYHRNLVRIKARKDRAKYKLLESLRDGHFNQARAQLCALETSTKEYADAYIFSQTGGEKLW